MNLRVEICNTDRYEGINKNSPFNYIAFNNPICFTDAATCDPFLFASILESRIQTVNKRLANQWNYWFNPWWKSQAWII